MVTTVATTTNIATSIAMAPSGTVYRRDRPSPAAIMPIVVVSLPDYQHRAPRGVQYAVRRGAEAQAVDRPTTPHSHHDEIGVALGRLSQDFPVGAPVDDGCLHRGVRPGGVGNERLEALHRFLLQRGG